MTDLARPTSAGVQANRAFLADLFAGPFRGHALVVPPAAGFLPPPPGPGDVACSDLPLGLWVDYLEQVYEARVRWQQALGDDAVPYAAVATGTHVFAGAFGCRPHIFPDSPAAAKALVHTAEEADALTTPAVDAPPLDRVFRAAEQLRRRLGPAVPLAVPDIQSPLDIAALVWHKEEFLVAMYDTPEAVERLIAKCHQLLKGFLHEFRRAVGEVNFCHCPYAWAPPELGCWLSEDEVGAISTEAFQRYALPTLVDLSETFGGIFIHCCAGADHQYDNFLKVPHLRGFNRVFQAPGPRPGIEKFAGRSVLMIAWYDEAELHKMLDMAVPESRFLFNPRSESLDDAKAVYERLRKRCPRR